MARVSHIAERLKVNKSSVSGALKNLSAKGYIDYDPYQFIRLRPSGEKVAKDISRRHEALRRFFVDILGVDDVLASETACKMEHHLDPAVLEPLVKYLEQTRAAALSDGSDR